MQRVITLISMCALNFLLLSGVVMAQVTRKGELIPQVIHYSSERKVLELEMDYSNAEPISQSNLPNEGEKKFNQIKCLSGYLDEKGQLFWTDVCDTSDQQEGDVSASIEAASVSQPGEEGITSQKKATKEENGQEDIIIENYSTAKTDKNLTKLSDQAMRTANKDKMKSVPEKHSPFVSKKNPLSRLEFGPEVYSFHYEEPGVMRDKGE